MAILKPYTFVAGTKAKASEVNADFDALYSEVNSMGSSLEQVEADVETLGTTKANINGNSGNRFAVANPVNSYDAVNKQYLFNSIANSLPYINGLGIAIDSDDTIHVDAGSAYDSTYTTIMVLDTSISKQNDTQSASTTYYVYLIAKANGADTDILISTSSASPALPTDYTLYRRIGSYTTNANNAIASISNESDTGVATITNSYSSGSAGYIVYSNGLCIQWGKWTGTIGAYASKTVTLAQSYKDTDFIVNVTADQAAYIIGGKPTAKDEFNHFSRFYDDDLGSATQPNANVYWRTIGYVS